MNDATKSPLAELARRQVGLSWRLSGAVIALAIVLRNSLNGSTKGYLRAKLTNFLPHDKIANYMVWDSLNKAQQVRDGLLSGGQTM